MNFCFMEHGPKNMYDDMKMVIWTWSSKSAWKWGHKNIMILAKIVFNSWSLLFEYFESATYCHIFLVSSNIYAYCCKYVPMR